MTATTAATLEDLHEVDRRPFLWYVVFFHIYEITLTS